MPNKLHRRRKPLATIRTPARDWSSLAPDLVRRVGSIFLATSDLDYYVSLRGVCYDWRAATIDPCGAELCFRAYGWVMLGSLDRDVAGEHDSRRLFLNVNTGRFMWKDMPMPHGQTSAACIAADDTNGLLILKSATDSEICVLNPFTRYQIFYPRTWASLERPTVRVQVRGEPAREVCTFWNDCLVVRNDTSRRCHPTSSVAKVAFQGRCAYVVDEKGYVMEEDSHSRRQEFRLVELASYHAQLYHTEFAAEPVHTFLVDNDGDVLLVRHWERSMGHDTIQVFRVDLKNKAVYPIQSIGDDRAIFLGNRCLSVDARKLPGIQGNCIYYISCSRYYKKRGICMFRLADKSHEKLYESFQPFESWPDEIKLAPVLPLSPPVLPLSLPQVLMDYPKYTWSVGSACPTWEYY